MRVVQLGKYYFPYMGGIESHLYTLAGELRQRVDLDVIVSNTGPRTLREVVRGVPVTRCGSVTTLASTSISPTMALELSLRDYDLLHIHLPHPMGVASYLASKKPRHHRLIVSYHSDVVRQRLLLKLYAPLVERLLDRADVVIATSPDYVESSEVLRRYRSRCTVVPYGVDLSLFAPSDATLRAAKELRERFAARHLLIAVGRLIYYKGFEYAIRAMSSVPEAHLLIVGDGPLRSTLEALAHERGVSARVHFVGEVHNDSIAPYYYASDVYLLPSVARSEAFGIVQIEAMACGLPVINTQLDSGVPFVSRHGESGLTVPPRDPEALAKAIKTLLDDPAGRKKLGQAGLERAKQEFAKEVLAGRLMAIYEGGAAG